MHLFLCRCMFSYAKLCTLERLALFIINIKLQILIIYMCVCMYVYIYIIYVCISDWCAGCWLSGLASASACTAISN